jgi:hypothetical protein
MQNDTCVARRGESIMPEIRRTAFRTVAAWTAAEMYGSKRWIYRFSESDVAELDAALASVKAGGAPLAQLTRADFPLPALGARLSDMLRELESGCGVMLLRGLPVARWGECDSMMVYWGISIHLGEVTGQNAAGESLGHVRATGGDWDKDHRVRGYQTTSLLPFHCDKGDIVGLLCMHGAKSGGESCIASSVAIHNAALERRPDLVEALYSPLYVDLRGEEPTGMRPYYLQPMYGSFKGRLFGRMGRKYVESAQRFPEVPRLTGQQIEAMEYVETLASSDEFRLDMLFEQGDIQFLNNHVVTHSRKEYEDYPTPEKRRHLVRILLFTELYRDVPAYIQHINDVTRWWRANPRKAMAAE